MGALAIATAAVLISYLMPSPQEPPAVNASVDARPAAANASPSSAPGEAAAASAPAPPPQPETNLCGYGRVKVDDTWQIRDRERESADKAFDAFKTALASSADPDDVALGFYLRGSTDALVAFATGRNNPQVYALALLACGYDTTPPGNCGMLSARQWADLEPDNGIPWLLIAGAAGNDKDARDQAVVRAAAARYFDPRTPDLLSLLRRPALRDVPPQTHAALQDELMVMQTGLPTLIYTPFLLYCGDPAVAQPTQTNTCRSLSETLLKDRTLLGFSTGIRLGELAGMPREQVEALRQQRGAYLTALNGAVSRRNERPASNCEELNEFDRWAADYTRLGETGLARRLLDAPRSSSAGAAQDGR